MLGRLFRKTRRSQPEASGLPADVLAVIEGATVTHRGLDGEGNARTMILWPGATASAWHHNAEATEQRIRAMFPHLNGDQVAQACRAMAARVQIAQREAYTEGNGTARHKSEWASWTAARRLSELPDLPNPTNY